MEFDFVSVGESGIKNKKYRIIYKEVEFVPTFCNFYAYNIFHSPWFQPWEKKNQMQEKITPVTNRKIQIQTLFSI